MCISTAINLCLSIVSPPISTTRRCGHSLRCIRLRKSPLNQLRSLNAHSFTPRDLMSTPMIKHPPFRRLTNPRQMHPSCIPRILRSVNMHSGNINPIRAGNLPPQLLLRQTPIQRPQSRPPTRALAQNSRRPRLRLQRRPRRKIPLPRCRRNMEPHFLKDAQRRTATDEDPRLKRWREVRRLFLMEEQHARAEDTALREHERGVVGPMLGDVLV